MAPSLREFPFKPSYTHEDGDLVAGFYVPALARSIRYRRATGYFTLDVLRVAARGLDALLAAKGRMDLLVGCTLGPEEVDEIRNGYDYRAAIARNLTNQIGQMGWTAQAPSEEEATREGLGHLARMIALGQLDVKVAVPLDAHGNVSSGGLYHSKLGILEDTEGNRLTFRGSVNETTAGWRKNTESFDVSLSWEPGRETERVALAEKEFDDLWEGRTKHSRVIDVPDAIKEELLKFLPDSDRQTLPPKPPEPAVQPTVEAEPEPEPEPPADVAAIWRFLRSATRRPADGTSVSLETGVVEPWPHQVNAYARMAERWPFRLLIADEVGLGKTIEAGLILRHAILSGVSKRTLLLVPAGVMTQWQAELYEKFNLVVPVYDGHKLLWPEVAHARRETHEEPVDRSGDAAWHTRPLVIASSHLMRRKDRAAELLNAPPWDLVILDEAHHARRKSPGTKKEGGPNRLLELMRALRSRTESLLLLTATPMQVHPVELWDLLDLVGLPAGWDEKTFLTYFDRLEANPDAAGLFELGKLFRGLESAYGPTPEKLIERLAETAKLNKIAKRKALKALRDPDSPLLLGKLDPNQRRFALALLRARTPVRDLMSRHTRPLLRRYIEEGILKAPIADRNVRNESVELSPKEREVYEAVERYISDTYNAAEKNLDGATKNAVGFVMTIYRRRLASSFAALQKTLTSRLAAVRAGTEKTDDAAIALRREDVLSDETAENVMDAETADDLRTRALQAEEKDALKELLSDVSRLSVDSKALKLCEQLKLGFKDGYDTAIVFSQFTDTIDFLKEHLATELQVTIGTYTGRGGEKHRMDGTWGKRTKEQVKADLREKRIEVLLCTDAAGEGLNLQSCGLLVNYDLPWNPMKVEQRIGRVDRIGQKFPTVRIVNLGYENTVETDVYFALSERIDLFTGFVGRLQPILAKLPHQLEEASRLSGEDARRGTAELLSRIQAEEKELENGFDIDEAGGAEEHARVLPRSPVTLEHLDRILADATMLPAGTETAPAGSRSHSVRLPGSADAARLTTSRVVFDEQSANQQLFAPGGVLFEAIADQLAKQASEPEADAAAWLRWSSAS